MRNIYYRATLCAGEEGLIIDYACWVSIHSTEHFDYCIPVYNDEKWQEFEKAYPKLNRLQIAKKRDLPIKRISKHSSRFAQPTRLDALKRLRFLKERQLKHMNREKRFIAEFLSKTESSESAATDIRTGTYSESHTLPETAELVHEFLIFC